MMPESPINLTSPVTMSNLGQTGFDLSWKTDVDGTTEAFYGHTPALELGMISGCGNRHLIIAYLSAAPHHRNYFTYSPSPLLERIRPKPRLASM